jgi:parallel beta-helix repeat protein
MGMPFIRRSIAAVLTAGVLLAGLARADIHYVWTNSPSAKAPYTNWTQAAHDIESAIRYAASNDTVLVTNGVYSTNGIVMYGALTNRIALTNFITVRSFNGPTGTIIKGNSPRGDAAVRCAYVAAGCVLDGFTLSNGATRAAGDTAKEQSGGGAWCESGGMISNCWFVSNTASQGGAAYGGTLSTCTLLRNVASGSGGGAYQATLRDCTVVSNRAANGGGAASCVLNGSALTNNTGTTAAGGAYQCTLVACTVAVNMAADGGGTYQATVVGCTLAGNSASGNGGGSYLGTLTNCTLVANSAAYYGGGAYQGTLTNCNLSANYAGWSGGGAYQSTLLGCRLAGNSAFYYGGGAYQGGLTNCTLMDNDAGYYGGGAYKSALRACTLAGNAAGYGGGGSYEGTLNNCTLTGNATPSRGGGAYQGTLANCIVYYNTASLDPNTYAATLRNCCTTPDPGASGNITAEPCLAAAGHIGAGSPCIGAGSSADAAGVDVDGEPWLPTPAIGADEPYATSTGALSVAISATYTQLVAGLSDRFVAQIDGVATGSAWSFGDGTVLTNRAYASHTWGATGAYPVVLRAWNADHPAGVACTTAVSVIDPPVGYVNLANPAPVFPYTNWAMAATNIQQAIAAGVCAGRLVLVTNGTYDAGGTVMFGALTNRVALTNGVTVRSVNGAAATTLRGNSPCGEAAVRCAYVGDDCTLDGFTLTNGATRSAGWPAWERYGGGLWCTVGGRAVNCTLAGNTASLSGGGAAWSTLTNSLLRGNTTGYGGGGAFCCMLSGCTLTGNVAQNGGGGSVCTFSGCTLAGNTASDNGGGAYDGVLSNCVLIGNTAGPGGGLGIGGGVFTGTLVQCVLASNSATNSGGGAAWSTLINCTVCANAASNDSGGMCGGWLTNCIVYYNTAPVAANLSGATAAYTCTTPDPGGPGNLTTDPGFVDMSNWANLRLTVASPCVNHGTSQAWMAGALDLDGHPRIIGGGVDMGAYETTNGVTTNNVPWGWLLQYGWATDGSADLLDPGGNGFPIWMRYVAGTDPTNNAARFQIVAFSNPAPARTYFSPSLIARLYTLQCSTNLPANSWTNVAGQCRVQGTGPGQGLSDTNAGAPTRFYRVLVELP